MIKIIQITPLRLWFHVFSFPHTDRSRIQRGDVTAPSRGGHRGFIAISRSNWTSYRIKFRDRKSRAVGISLSPGRIRRGKRRKGEKGKSEKERNIRGDRSSSADRRKLLAGDVHACQQHHHRLIKELQRRKINALVNAHLHRVSDPFFFAPRTASCVLQIELKRGRSALSASTRNATETIERDGYRAARLFLDSMSNRA